jgi:two-component system, NarL family, nitrate/nitrite response regulator NarL
LERLVRILLADDNPKIRAALRLLTEELGHTTCEAIDVDTLLQHLRDHPADLLLLDWELPGFSPTVYMQEIRRLSPCCVVAAMSGRPEARTESGRLGA